jgi:hypothetical protein
MTRWASLTFAQIAKAFPQIAPEQPGQLVLVEAQEAQVVVGRLQLTQFNRQQIVIPFGQRCRLVVRDPICLDLFRRQILGDVDRHVFQTQLLCRLPPRVPADDDALRIDHDGLAEPEFAERRRNGIDRVIVDPRVVGVRLRLGQGP